MQASDKPYLHQTSGTQANYAHVVSGGEDARKNGKEDKLAGSN